MKKIIIYGIFIIIPYQSTSAFNQISPEENIKNFIPITTQTTIKSNYPVDISMMIADIKYNDEELKICELGEGAKSYYAGHEKLFGPGKIWLHFWEYLSQFHIPIWYVGNKPYLALEKEAAFKEFTEMGGLHAKSLFELNKDSLLQKIKNQFIKKNNHIEDYHGIIVLRKHRETSHTINIFKKSNPGFIFINNASKLIINNKMLTNNLFKDDFLQNFKPKWQTYEKIYTPQLTKKIINDFPQCNTFVIKPINAANGWGVIIIEKNNLDETLKKIFKQREKIKQEKDDSYRYWGKDLNKNFIIEEWIPSKTITVNEKLYDATLRILFVMTYKENKISTTFLGGYWKLPKLSLNENGNLIEKHKSKVDHKKLSSAKISQKDMSNVKKILINVLPKLYEKMLTYNHSKNRLNQHLLQPSIS